MYIVGKKKKLRHFAFHYNNLKQQKRYCIVSNDQLTEEETVNISEMEITHIHVR